MSTAALEVPAGSDERAAAPATPARHRRSAGRRAVAGLGIARATMRVVVGVVLAVAAITSIAGAAYVVVNRIGFSPVLSPSMQPTFAPGDLVLTRPEATSDIKVGQIVALPIPNEPGQRYVHRVISVKHENGQVVVRTKGDNNAAPENYQLRVTSKTVPQVVHVIPKMGRTALLFRGGTYRIAVIVLIGFFGLVGVKRLILDRG